MFLGRPKFSRSVGVSVQIVGRPEQVQRARLSRVEPEPRLAGAGPMQEADRAGMQVPTAAPDVVTT